MRLILSRSALTLAAFLPFSAVAQEAADAAPRQVAPVSTCRPDGYDRDALLALKRDSFTIANDAHRNALALALLDCLGDPDPAIRDGVAYEALTAFMRGKRLTQPTLVTMRERLLVMLEGPEGEGFVRPFAALVLSEVARTDRIGPYLTPDERTSLVTVATEYVKGVTDYRGFDEREGWRHGVAHGADFLMQLAYNPQVGNDDLRRILDAVASQVSPPGHLYEASEGDRLARPVLAVAERGALTEAEWSAWLARVASPAPFASWQAARQTDGGETKARNVEAFLAFIHRIATGQYADRFTAIRPGVEAALASLTRS